MIATANKFLRIYYARANECLEMSIKVQSKNALNNKFSKNAYIFD